MAVSAVADRPASRSPSVPFLTFGPSSTFARRRVIWPLLTPPGLRFRLAASPSAKPTALEVSPGKDMDLHCIPAWCTAQPLDSLDFTGSRPLIRSGRPDYQVRVPRVAALPPASFGPTSRIGPCHWLAIEGITIAEDFHLLIRAHAGHTGPPASRLRIDRIWPGLAPGAHPGH